MSLTWRPLTAADAPAWSELVDAVSLADGADDHYSPADLAEEIDEESLAVVDGSALVAVGQVEQPVREHDGVIRTGFEAAVHPDHRGQGIGSQLLQRCERRARELAHAEYGAGRVVVRTSIAEGAVTARALVESAGFRIVRWFEELRVEPQPSFRSPRLQRYRPELDPALRAAHVEAFATHWGSAPVSDARWSTYVTGSRTFRPEYSSIAATIDGTVDGYALAYEFEPGTIWIGQLGVRPRLRRRGLGHSLLMATLAEAAAGGIATVKLWVDSANRDGAGELYRKAGFRSERSLAVYQRD